MRLGSFQQAAARSQTLGDQIPTRSAELGGDVCNVASAWGTTPEPSLHGWETLPLGAPNPAPRAAILGV